MLQVVHEVVHEVVSEMASEDDGRRFRGARMAGLTPRASRTGILVKVWLTTRRCMFFARAWACRIRGIASGIFLQTLRLREELPK